MMDTNRKFVATICAGIYLVTLQKYVATAFVPSLYSARNHFNLYTEVEDSAESLHFATVVARKDHTGPVLSRQDSKDTTDDTKLAQKKSRSASNRKKNDPKPYGKKTKRPTNRNNNNKNEKNTEEVGVSLRKQRDTRKSVSEFEIGKEYKGKVARVVSYGAFVDVGAKASALLHVSRISQKKIENIRNWVNEGDTVNVRIVSVDDKKNTLAVSMLDIEADEYLNKRSKQLKKKNEDDAILPRAILKPGSSNNNTNKEGKPVKKTKNENTNVKLVNKKGESTVKKNDNKDAQVKLVNEKGKNTVKKNDHKDAQENLVTKKKGNKIMKKEGSEDAQVKIVNKKNGKKNAKNGKKPVKKTESETILPLTELKLGSKVEGRVAAFTEFGVFIKINYNLKNKGGAGYALLHKSQIRDEAVEDPKKLFRIGNVVKDLRILTINYEKGEVGVSLRKQRDTRKSMSEFEIGKEYKGKVARVVSYGAFIDVGAKANALLHISRISQKKIENIRNWVNEGDTVNVRIVSVDDKKNTLAASMLDMEADEYLNKRSKQLKKMRQRSDEKNAKLDGGQLKSELEYFEDAVQDLENALR
eukprot:scaffold10203_cov272-Chaetoceros_neogracile.AAC.49